MKFSKSFLAVALFFATAATAMADDVTYSVTVPQDAEFFMGIKPKNSSNKIIHYAPFTEVEPTSTTTEGDNKVITYTLTSGTQYNYRTWKTNGLTQGGIFYANTDATKMPALSFSSDSYASQSPKTVETDVDKMGDMYVNINERGHLKMTTGQTYDATALRNWEAIEGWMNNYFIEPSFHYTVTDVNGNADNSVISLDTYDTTKSPWVTITAKQKGTAIVTVTYDAMELHQYASGSATATDFFKGSFYGASLPQNTAVYVVSVDDADNSITPNMTINSTFTNTNKNAGANVDAELDVFYYAKGKAGYNYTFTPTGVTSVDMAYPTLGTNAATYSGFSTTGVTANADGSYTLLLKEGRQIVRLQDASGNAVYQVLTAKPVEMTVTNTTTGVNTKFAPGDKVSVKFNTVYHPANKLAGVYNDNATIYYNNGSVKGTGNQYAFAGTAAAQTVSFTIPSTYTDAVYSLSNGNICVSGWGDYLGNHRGFTKDAGRNPNMSAGSIKAYCGALPDINIALANIPFDDATLAEGTTYYNGSDGAGLFESNGYSFMSYYDSDYASWCGFALSATTGNTYSGSWTDDTQFNSCTAGGMKSDKFAVGYYSEYNALMDDQYPEIYATKNFKPEYVYITNTAQAIKSMTNGDSYAKKFTADDYLLLTITGLTDDDDETGHIDFYLAKDGKMVNDWTKVDLTPLGTVNHIRFTMDSSDKSYGFINTPCYFCLDNMQAELTDDDPVAALEITLNEKGYGTFSAAENRTILTAGVKAYKASVADDNITLTELDGYIPAGTGVLLYGEGMESKSVLFSAYTSSLTAANVTDNSLLPTTTADGAIVDMSTVSGTVWALGTANKFLQYTGTAFTANRAYLIHSAATAKAMNIIFAGDATTAIDAVSTHQSLDATSPAYNLAGQRVTNSAKGIVVKNGKKYIIK